LKLFKWGYGRHDTGYRAFTLIYSKFFKLDCYLIHYNKGSSIPPHRDPVKTGDMYRFNIEFWRAKKGGVFHSKTIFTLFNRIFFFRPDLEEHYVTEIEEGNRWVFSIGKIIENKA